MRWIACLLAASILGPATPARAGSSPPKLLLRIYVQTTGEGMPSTEAQPVVVPPDNETILIRSMPEVTEANLVDVRTDGSGYVHLFFDHTGQVDLDAVTAQDQGRIMVVMLNGYIIYAPLIDEQITTGELVIPHAIDPTIVRLLQDIAQRNVKHAKSI